jgi:hypothetical protein
VCVVLSDDSGKGGDRVIGFIVAVMFSLTLTALIAYTWRVES